MSLQDKYSNSGIRPIRKKSKKAVSVIIGYVLLITFAVVLGIIVYKWMKTYVPQEEINCPDGTSLFIESYTYNCTSGNGMLALDLKNNGKFDIGGYFIYATDAATEEKAAIDLSPFNTDNNSKMNPLGIKFGAFTVKNALTPNDVERDLYNLTIVNPRIYSVEIVPVRWQTINRKMELVSCKNAGIKEEIECN